MKFLLRPGSVQRKKNNLFIEMLLGAGGLEVLIETRIRPKKKINLFIKMRLGTRF